MYIKFNSSKFGTLGLELEVQTISPRTGELVNGAGIILSQLQGNIMFKPELFNSTLEINTPICENLEELESALNHNLEIVEKIAKENNLKILISGCHPFSNWQYQQITRRERYQNLLSRIQWPVRQFLIFGLHVHVGIDDADKAIYIMNRLTWYLPHLIALSASSPFWNGFDTGLATTRIKIFEELPNAGIPYYFDNWDNYSQLVHQLIKTNSIDTVRDIWWDIRPHPIFGTIEVRICDAMPTLKENLGLTAMIYSLIRKFDIEFKQNGKIQHVERWILEENKWRAARYGIMGKIILDNKGNTRSLKDEVQSLYEEMVTFGKQQNITYLHDYLKVIPEIIDSGPSYLRQRAWAREKPGDYKYIVNNLLKEKNGNILLNNNK